jgi:predicted nucleic acid-binding protein
VTGSGTDRGRTPQRRRANHLGDTLIDGICRLNGERVVTLESYFERVDGLEVDSD